MNTGVGLANAAEKAREAIKRESFNNPEKSLVDTLSRASKNC